MPPRLEEGDIDETSGSPVEFLAIGYRHVGAAMQWRGKAGFGRLDLSSSTKAGCGALSLSKLWKIARVI